MADCPEGAALRLRVIEALLNSRNVTPSALLPTASAVVGYIESGSVPAATPDANAAQMMPWHGLSIGPTWGHPL